MSTEIPRVPYCVLGVTYGWHRGALDVGHVQRHFAPSRWAGYTAGCRPLSQRGGLIRSRGPDLPPAVILRLRFLTLRMPASRAIRLTGEPGLAALAAGDGVDLLEQVHLVAVGESDRDEVLAAFVIP